MGRLMKLSLIAITLVISACAANAVTAPLPMPSRPDMPTVTDADLQCVSDAVYRRLAKKDLAYKYYTERLQAVIKSTWDD